MGLVLVLLVVVLVVLLVSVVLVLVSLLVMMMTGTAVDDVDVGVVGGVYSAHHPQGNRGTGGPSRREFVAAVPR